MDFTIFLPLVENIIKIIIVIVPLRIAIEFLEEYGVIKWIAKKVEFLTRWYEFSHNSLLPMVAGWFLGVYMGGMMLIDFHSDKKISQDDTNKVMSVWMFAHGLIDETAVFTVIGASLVWILSIRIFFALFLVKLIIILSKRGVSLTV